MAIRPWFYDKLFPGKRLLFIMTHASLPDDIYFLEYVCLTERSTSLEPLKTDRPLLRRAVPVKGGDKSADKKSLCSAVETVIDYTENRIQSK